MIQIGSSGFSPSSKIIKRASHTTTPDPANRQIHARDPTLPSSHVRVPAPSQISKPPSSSSNGSVASPSPVIQAGRSHGSLHLHVTTSNARIPDFLPFQRVPTASHPASPSAHDASKDPAVRDVLPSRIHPPSSFRESPPPRIKLPHPRIPASVRVAPSIRFSFRRSRSTPQVIPRTALLPESVIPAASSINPTVCEHPAPQQLPVPLPDSRHLQRPLRVPANSRRPATVLIHRRLQGSGDL